MRHYIIAALLFGAFLLLTLSVMTNDSLMQWDFETFQKINSKHGALIDFMMFIFSAYGREVVWIGVVGFLFVFGKAQGRKVAILLVITFLVLIPSGIVIKDVVDRPRPSAIFTDLLFTKEHNDPSFPSGHALITSAGACIMLTQYASGRQKILSLILGFEAAVVGFSLIYVGAHYLLDVVGGILFGTSISFVMIGLQNKFEPLFRFTDSIAKRIR